MWLNSKAYSSNVCLWLVCAAVVCVFGGTVFGQPWDGNGVEGDPYLIYDACDMQAIGAEVNYWDAHFKLMADIDMNEIEYNIIAANISSSKWIFEGEYFVGSFDGDGHVIKNLTINDINQSYIGLFGYIGTGGEIKNLKLENINLEGFSYLGAVAGKSKGSIINCFSETYIQSYYGFAGGLVGENDGNVSLSSSFSTVKGCVDLGGLVGWNDGTIDKCDSKGVVRINIQNGGSIGGLVGFNKGDVFDSFSNSSVYGSNANDSGGGLAGVNSGIIKRCHSNGDVRETAYSAGGLVGYNGGEINNCYANGEVSGVYDMGGLVGWNDSGDISSSYATGNVHGEEEVGGLTGWTSKGSITNCYSSGDVNGIVCVGGLSGGISAYYSNFAYITYCYSIGNVNGNENTGGLVGWVNEQSIVVESFWDIDINPDLNDIGNVGDDPNIIGLPTAQMQDANTYIDAAWDFNTPIWKFCSLPDYPKLAWEACPGPVGPVEMLVELGEMVEELGLSEGVENSLLAKVEAATGVLEDDNEKNDGAAVNILGAFINAASAQSGKKIAESQAEGLIAEAAAIIEVLESGAEW